MEIGSSSSWCMIFVQTPCWKVSKVGNSFEILSWILAICAGIGHWKLHWLMDLHHSAFICFLSKEYCYHSAHIVISGRHQQARSAATVLHLKWWPVRKRKWKCNGSTIDSSSAITYSRHHTISLIFFIITIIKFWLMTSDMEFSHIHWKWVNVEIIVVEGHCSSVVMAIRFCSYAWPAGLIWFVLQLESPWCMLLLKVEGCVHVATSTMYHLGSIEDINILFPR